jgi:TPP-dependent pyruvate/acetoin dehydrogenase alpha subunit
MPIANCWQGERVLSHTEKKRFFEVGNGKSREPNLIDTDNFELDDLADPSKFTAKLDISGCDCALLKAQLRMMLVIRRVEEKIGDGVTAGTIVCPCHLGIGQEAIAVGISHHLRASDRVFGTHRSHSHFLALGGSVYSLLAEVLGKLDGCSRGMGGSMHLHAPKHGFMGSVPIVGGTVPLAVGAALAAKKDKRGDVAVAYFGDGAAEEGVLHESLNLASAFKLPVLFVCENNLFSSHLHISLRQPANRVARYGHAHRMRAESVDGNDVVAVSDVSNELVARMRQGEGPAFLEAVTYRWRGHVGPSEDNDVGVNRGVDLVRWKGRDPIRRLFEALKDNSSIMDDGEWELMNDEVVNQVAEAWTRAEAAPFPADRALLDLVYAETA